MQQTSASAPGVRSPQDDAQQNAGRVRVRLIESACRCGQMLKMKAKTQSGGARVEASGTNFTSGQDLFARAVGFRATANDLQSLMNSLASGSVVAEQAKGKLFGYFLSVTVLRALSAECMLKAIAFARTGRFDHGHNLSALYEALDGKTRGFIETTADSHGVASPKRVLKRHKDDFVNWRYPADGEQKTDLLDLDRTLSVLDAVFRQIGSGKGPLGGVWPSG